MTEQWTADEAKVLHVAMTDEELDELLELLNWTPEVF